LDRVHGPIWGKSVGLRDAIVVIIERSEEDTSVASVGCYELRSNTM